MIQQPTNYLPVQQAAVQQQMQQGYVPTPAQEFSAIKINILGANVAPNQMPPQMPVQAPATQSTVAPQLPEGQKVNYLA